MICSESTLDAEIKFISMILCNNSLPLNVVQTVITNKITEFNKIKQASVQKYPVYLCLLWLGRISDRFAKQISQTVHRCYFSANVWVVFNIKPILTSIHKDVLPPHHNNSLIYLFRCSCDLCSIERINQRLNARIKQYIPMKIPNFIGSLTENFRNT